MRTIETEMKKQRQDDKIEKVLSNKFCIAYPAFEDGSLSKLSVIFGLDNDTIYQYGWTNSIRERIESTLILPNIDFRMTCYNFPENKRYAYYIRKTIDNRRSKRIYRKLSRLLN